LKEHKGEAGHKALVEHAAAQPEVILRKMVLQEERAATPFLRN
jgi:hypothetical protein